MNKERTTNENIKPKAKEINFEEVASNSKSLFEKQQKFRKRQFNKAKQLIEELREIGDNFFGSASIKFQAHLTLAGQDILEAAQNGYILDEKFNPEATEFKKQFKK